ETGRFERRFVCFCSARRKVHRLHVTVREGDEPFCKADRGNIGRSGICREKGQILHLTAGSLCQFSAAVSDINVPQPREPIEVLVSLEILYYCALPSCIDGTMIKIHRMMEGMEQMSAIDP